MSDHDERPLDQPGGCLGTLSALGELGLWIIMGLLFLVLMLGPGAVAFNKHVAPLDQVGQNDNQVQQLGE